MAKDLAEKEREFIDQLAADTGRDLASWMVAISESGEVSRNSIIDWLRQKGFPFPKASWLERIHHNGGRLIYGTEGPTASDVAKRTDAARTIGEPKIEPDADLIKTPVPEIGSPATTTTQLAAFRDDEISKLLASAKGLRPLAELISREVETVVPSARMTVSGAFLNFGEPAPFAALLPQPKELRLFADFGPSTRDRTKKADTARYPTSFPDVLSLSDARQIDDRFREIIAAAYGRSLV